MNRARVKNLLLNTASVFASVTETEPVPITNPNLGLNRNRYSRLQSTSAALKPVLIPKQTMIPDSS